MSDNDDRTGGSSSLTGVLLGLGAVAILIGSVDPLSLALWLLPGSIVFALGSLLGQTRGRWLVLCACLLIVVSVAGSKEPSPMIPDATVWWKLYLIGWLMALCGVPYALSGFFRERTGCLVAVGIWILIAPLWVWFIGTRTYGAMQSRRIGSNGGFEIANKNGLPANWCCMTRDTGVGFSLDPHDPLEGKQSLRITVQGPPAGYAHLFQTRHDLKPKGTYEVSFWLKNQGCEAGLEIRNEGKDHMWPSEAEKRDLAAHPPIGKGFDERITGVNVWRQYKLVYEVPESDASIRFEMHVTRPGTLWIDDVRIQEVQDDYPAVPSSWTFDTDSSDWKPMMNVVGMTCADGRLAFRTTSDDPAILVDMRCIRAADFSTIVVTMQLTGPLRDKNTAQLFWSTDGQAFTESASVRFPVIGDGQTHTYTADLKANPRWHNRILMLRFDPCNTKDVQVAVDEILLK